MGKKFYIKNLICNKSVLVINNNKTYFGALEVIEKILFGSKSLNINFKYI